MHPSFKTLRLPLIAAPLRNDRLEHDTAVRAKYKVPIVNTSLGAQPEINDAVHAWGGVGTGDALLAALAEEAACT